MTQKECLLKIRTLCDNYLSRDSSATLIKQIRELAEPNRIPEKNTRVMYHTRDGRNFDSLIATLNASTGFFDDNHISFDVYPQAEVTGKAFTYGTEPPVTITLDQWAIAAALFILIRGLRDGELFNFEKAVSFAARDMSTLPIFKEYPTKHDVIVKYIKNKGELEKLYTLMDFKREANAVVANSMSFTISDDAPTVPALAEEAFSYMSTFMTLHRDEMAPPTFMPRNHTEMACEGQMILSSIENLEHDISTAVADMFKE